MPATDRSTRTEADASVVSYALADERRTLFERFIEETAARPDCTYVCDVGGGVKPFLEPERLAADGLRCTVIDVSAEETAGLDRSVYDVVVSDASDRTLLDRHPELAGRFDLTFSKFVMEHVPSSEAFLSNLFAMTAPGGRSIHLFPTLFAAPFVVNKVTPDRMATWILDTVAPRGRSKFPALYDWCRGPSDAQLERMRSVGWEVERYVGLMGHTYYRRIPGVRDAHKAAARVALAHPRPAATSYAVMVLRKPDASV